jgi:hypothetical protein
MNFSRTGSVVSFLAALAIGVAAAYFVSPWSIANEIAVVPVPVTLGQNTCRYGMPRVATPTVRVEAKNLVGHWKGTWGYGDPEAIIYIDRAEGNKIFGNLTVHGALIALEGTVDSGNIYLHETEVLSIDKGLGRWSLGNDSGTFSADGQAMYGTGQDDYGFYQWGMTKEK